MTNRPPPLPQLPNIQETAIRLWNQIPAGRVATYGSLAKALGSSTASRWVGSFAKSHKHLAQCGCHRLVRADGSLGSYVTGEIDEKATLLHADGITFTNGKVNVSEFRFDGFQGKAPLDRLADWPNTKTRSPASSISRIGLHPPRPKLVESTFPTQRLRRRLPPTQLLMPKEPLFGPIPSNEKPTSPTSLVSSHFVNCQS